MIIALAQLNYTIADFQPNSRKIIEHIERAKEAGADLVVFSELSVCGYPPQDLLEQASFMESVNQSVSAIADHCKGIAAIIGAPVINHSNHGKKLLNAALFLMDGQIHFTQHKTHLPTYDIFDEYRYFEHNTTFNTIDYKGERIALTICEDLWDHQPVENSFAKNNLYTISPIEELGKSNPDFVINIAASPFSYNQANNRKDILINNSLQHKLPIIYVNQTGANTELIFDGGSMVLNANGQLIHQLKRFEEDFQLIDTQKISTDAELPELAETKIQLIHDALILGIKDYFSKSGFSKATLGLSGGIDSAVCLALAAEALGPENMEVLLMPSPYSSGHSVDDAVAMANNLHIKYHILPISSAYHAVKQELEPIFSNLPFDLAEENIQARLRGVLLMAFSNKFGHILLNTSNKSEAAVGYGTLYGDMNGGLSVLGDVYKTDVFALAHYINREREIIPMNTILKPPSAELRPNQKDSDSLPDYAELDAILFQYIEQRASAHDIINAGYPAAIVHKVIRMVDRSEYKRFQSPPILRVSSKAFGFGRRLPIVARY